MNEEYSGIVSEEVNENETLNDDEIEEETVQTDYSETLQDIIDNQLSIISNQETLIQQNTDILSNLEFQNNALKGITNIFVLAVIVFVGFFIAKNIFIKIIQ